MSEDELDLVPTDELCAALSRRSNAVVVTILVETKKKDEQQPILYWSGGIIQAMGLAIYSADRMRRILECRIDAPENEDLNQ